MMNLAFQFNTQIIAICVRLQNESASLFYLSRNIFPQKMENGNEKKLDLKFNI